MPAHKAFIIPLWAKRLQAQADSNSLYMYLPALMQWRNADFMEEQLLGYTASPAEKHQLGQIFTHLKSLVQQVDTLHPLVSRLSMSQFIPDEIIVTFAPDVKTPEATGHVVLRVDDKGDIKGVAREYTMSYAANK